MVLPLCVISSLMSSRPALSTKMPAESVATPKPAATLVLSAAGGSQGGGASLTPHGEAVLACYEAMLADINRVTASYQGQLGGWLRDGAIEPSSAEKSGAD